jgi:hypothetical protein
MGKDTATEQEVKVVKAVICGCDGWVKMNNERENWNGNSSKLNRKCMHAEEKARNTESQSRIFNISQAKQNFLPAASYVYNFQFLVITTFTIGVESSRISSSLLLLLNSLTKTSIAIAH